MNSDQTHPQNTIDQRHAKQLSLLSSALPEIPGFQPLRLLGQGAYGRMWLAADLNTRRPVAIYIGTCSTQVPKTSQVDILGIVQLFFGPSASRAWLR